MCRVLFCLCSVNHPGKRNTSLPKPKQSNQQLAEQICKTTDKFKRIFTFVEVEFPIFSLVTVLPLWSSWVNSQKPLCYGLGKHHGLASNTMFRSNWLFMPQKQPNNSLGIMIGILLPQKQMQIPRSSYKYSLAWLEMWLAVWQPWWSKADPWRFIFFCPPSFSLNQNVRLSTIHRPILQARKIHLFKPEISRKKHPSVVNIFTLPPSYDSIYICPDLIKASF